MYTIPFKAVEKRRTEYEMVTTKQYLSMSVLCYLGKGKSLRDRQKWVTIGTIQTHWAQKKFVLVRNYEIS